MDIFSWVDSLGKPQSEEDLVEDIISNRLGDSKARFRALVLLNTDRLCSFLASSDLDSLADADDFIGERVLHYMMFGPVDRDEHDPKDDSTMANSLADSSGRTGGNAVAAPQTKQPNIVRIRKSTITVSRGVLGKLQPMPKINSMLSTSTLSESQASFEPLKTARPSTGVFSLSFEAEQSLAKRPSSIVDIMKRYIVGISKSVERWTTASEGVEKELVSGYKSLVEETKGKEYKRIRSVIKGKSIEDEVKLDSLMQAVIRFWNSLDTNRVRARRYEAVKKQALQVTSFQSLKQFLKLAEDSLDDSADIFTACIASTAFSCIYSTCEGCRLIHMKSLFTRSNKQQSAQLCSFLCKHLSSYGKLLQQYLLSPEESYTTTNANLAAQLSTLKVVYDYCKHMNLLLKKEVLPHSLESIVHDEPDAGAWKDWKHYKQLLEAHQN